MFMYLFFPRSCTIAYVGEGNHLTLNKGEAVDLNRREVGQLKESVKVLQVKYRKDLGAKAQEVPVLRGF